MNYMTAQMEWLFSDETTINLWRTVELAVLEQQAEAGLIPGEWVEETRLLPQPSPMLWKEATDAHGHEMVGFLAAWGAKHVHIGITSSDVIDTANSLRLRDAHEMILGAIDHLGATLAVLEVASEDVLKLGRTHGQPATVMLLRQMFENWSYQLERRDTNLRRLAGDAFTCKISGPVGSYLHITPDIEARVAADLGLRVAEGTTQIIARDALASYVSELGVLMRLVEAISLEVRLMAQSAVGEAKDSTGSTSSTMPHKNNPNAYERFTGLSRIVNAAIPALTQGVVQWGERDLAHSSVERTYLPIVFGTTHYAVENLAYHLGKTLFNVMSIYGAIEDNQVEALTHSAQYAFQIAGLSYEQAREETAKLYKSKLTGEKFVKAVKDHPIKPHWEKPTATTKQTEEGLND